MKQNLTHGSLFSGIGGFDLAAKWSGIETVTDVRVPNFTYRIGALGNTVSPIVVKYVFDCIIQFDKDI